MASTATNVKNKIVQFSPAIQTGLIMALLANNQVKISYLLTHADDSDSLGRSDVIAELNLWDCVGSLIALGGVFATLIPESKKVLQEKSWLGGYFVALKSITTALFAGIPAAILADASKWASRCIVGGNISFTALLLSFTLASGKEFCRSRMTAEESASAHCLAPSLIFNFFATLGAAGVLATLPQFADLPDANLACGIITAAMFLPITAIEAAKIKKENRKSGTYGEAVVDLFIDDKKGGDAVSKEEKMPLLLNEDSEDREKTDPVDRKKTDPVESSSAKSESWGAWFSRKATETASAVAYTMEACTVICGS